MKDPGAAPALPNGNHERSRPPMAASQRASSKRGSNGAAGHGYPRTVTAVTEPQQATIERLHAAGAAAGHGDHRQ